MSELPATVGLQDVATNVGRHRFAANTGASDKPRLREGPGGNQSPRQAETQAGLTSASDATATDGAHTLTDGADLAAGASWRILIRFAVTRNLMATGYNESRPRPVPPMEMAYASSARGLFNEVLVDDRKDSDGDQQGLWPTVPPRLRLLATGTQNMRAPLLTDLTNQQVATYATTTTRCTHGAQSPRSTTDAVVKTLDPGHRDRRILLSVGEQYRYPYWLVETRACADNSPAPRVQADDRLSRRLREWLKPAADATDAAAGKGCRPGLLLRTEH